MKKGILLVNIGSPDSPSVPDVRRYLREFLSDKRVIDASYLMRKFIVEVLILPKRPKFSAEAYRKIWWEKGSPLIVISQQLKRAISERLSVPVSLGMRYGHPSILSGLEELYMQQVREVLVFPLYPQFAMSTSESVMVKTFRVGRRHFKDMKVVFFPPFFQFRNYISALGESIALGLTQGVDHLLFSYHGVPKRHIYETDLAGHCRINDCCFRSMSESHSRCYRYQCYETTRRTAEWYGLPLGQYSISFQSRLGNDPWLKPYTDKTLEVLGKSGVKNLAVVAPSFTTDCLETLEELAMGGRDIFLRSGGEFFTYIPCLNIQEAWVTALSNWCKIWLSEKVVFKL
ncbi:MAG: ferrochelatase [Flavobacteriales bacterium AspAUS03]